MLSRRSALLALAFLLAAPLAALAPPAHAQTPDADALIERLQATYGGDRAVRAQFTQTIAQNGQTRTLGGTLTLAGERYRVETDRQTLVTDGETTWIYTPAREQVLVNDYAESETAFSPGRFFDGYQERYRVDGVRAAQRDGARHHVLTLAPRQNGAFFQEVTLWMRASDAVITRMKVEDANGSQMTFTLRDVTFDAEPTAGTFQFEAPPEAEVVDLRS